MTITNTIAIISVVVAILSLLNGWLLYSYKSRKKKEDEDLKKLEEKVESEANKVEHFCEKIDLRVSNLEKHSITEAKTKDLIDRAIAPIQSGLNEIKSDGKESQKDLKKLLLGFSNLIGQLGVKIDDMGKE